MIKTFKQYLAEEHEHEDGTYASLHLDAASSKALTAFIKSYGFANPCPVEKAHCTVMYSSKALSDKGHFIDEVDIPATIIGFKALGHEGEKMTLVATLDCPGATKAWKHYKQLGAAWDYPSYIPHISVAYDISDKTKIPELKQKLKLRFDRLEITPLATDWKKKEGVTNDKQTGRR